MSEQPPRSAHGQRSKTSLTKTGGALQVAGDPQVSDALAYAMQIDDVERDQLTHGFHSYPARMHWAMSGLARSDLLTAEERARALESAASDMTNFDAGHGVVAAHGRLTETGRQLMASAERYMHPVR